MTTDTPIWQQQPGESAKAYAAWCLYRDAGPAERSLRAVNEEYYKGKSNVAQLSKWSIKFQWVERAKTYDAYLADKRREQFEALRLDQREKRQQVVQALNGMLMRVMALNGLPDTKLSVSDLNRLASAAAKVLAESRAEFHDMPPQRSVHEVGGKDGGPIEHALTITRVDARTVDTT